MCVFLCLCEKERKRRERVCVFECVCEESRDTRDVTTRHSRPTSEPVSFICQQKTRKKKNTSPFVYHYMPGTASKEKSAFAKTHIFFCAKCVFAAAARKKCSFFASSSSSGKVFERIAHNRNHLPHPSAFTAVPSLSLSLSVCLSFSLRPSLPLNVCIICMYVIHTQSQAHTNT